MFQLLSEGMNWFINYFILCVWKRLSPKDENLKSNDIFVESNDIHVFVNTQLNIPSFLSQIRVMIYFISPLSPAQQLMFLLINNILIFNRNLISYIHSLQTSQQGHNPRIVTCSIKNITHFGNPMTGYLVN